MISVSLSGAEDSIDSVWLWYERASHSLRNRLQEERAAVDPLAHPIFLGMTPEEVAEFFVKLDYLVMLDLLSATEAAMRVDFFTRVKQRRKDDLSLSFRELSKKHGEKIALEEHILEAWTDRRPEVRSSAGDFKGALRLRHWLAHGRYWTPKLARRAYSTTDIFDICDQLLRKMGLK